MSRTRIMRAMQAVLLMTVLTPATVYADQLSTRQMLAQAQTQSQDQAVKGEIQRMNRGLIVGAAQATTNSSEQHPVEISSVSVPAMTAPTTPAPVATVEAPHLEIPSLPPHQDDKPIALATSDTFEIAAVPATPTSTSQAPTSVTLPALAQSATDGSVRVASNSPTEDLAVAQASAAPVEPTVVVPTPSPVTTSVGSKTTSSTAEADVVRPGPSKPASTKTTSAQSSRQRHTRGHADDSLGSGFNISAENIGGQLTKIMNRPDVKSMLAQYGLN